MSADPRGISVIPHDIERGRAFRARFGIPNEDDVFDDVSQRIGNSNTIIQALKARICK